LRDSLARVPAEVVYCFSLLTARPHRQRGCWSLLNLLTARLELGDHLLHVLWRVEVVVVEVADEVAARLRGV